MIVVCRALVDDREPLPPLDQETEATIVHHATIGSPFESTGLAPPFLEHWYRVLEEVVEMYHPSGDRWEHLRRGCC